MDVSVQMAIDGAPLMIVGVACMGARERRATGLEMRGPLSACTAKRATLRLRLWYALQISLQHDVKNMYSFCSRLSPFWATKKRHNTLTALAFL